MESTWPTEQPLLSIPGRKEHLRPWRASDADALLTACQDPEIPRWTTVPSPYGRADAKSFLAGAAEWWSTQEEAAFCISDEQHRVFGSITWFAAQGELGYWLAAPARGRGLLTAAAESLLDWAARQGARSIGIAVLVGNLPSIKVARRLGAHHTGVRLAPCGPHGDALQHRFQLNLRG
ncbi:MAG: GNAT family N-acetyltransferase [Microthrixaceae bacterium]